MKNPQIRNGLNFFIHYNWKINFLIFLEIFYKTWICFIIIIIIIIRKTKTCGMEATVIFFTKYFFKKTKFLLVNLLIYKLIQKYEKAGSQVWLLKP